jgi:hypothetical protein
MRFFAFVALVIGLSGCMIPGAGSMPEIIGAARDGDLPRLQQLLEAGADPNERAGVNSWTPLMHAIHKNQPGSVQLLLSHGARVNERGGGGSTPLIMAAGYGYSDIVTALLKAGADPNLRAANGDDALSAAVGGVSDIDRFTVGHCQTDTVRVLLAAAPDLRLTSDSGALRIAKFGGCAEVLRMEKR